MVRIEMKYGCYIYCDDIAVHNIYSIDIDKENKSIEFNDITGFVIANINNYSNVEEIGFVEYNAEDELNKFSVLIVENGKMTYQKGDENYEVC